MSAKNEVAVAEEQKKRHRKKHGPAQCLTKS